MQLINLCLLRGIFMFQVMTKILKQERNWISGHINKGCTELACSGFFLLPLDLIDSVSHHDRLTSNVGSSILCPWPIDYRYILYLGPPSPSIIKDLAQMGFWYWMLLRNRFLGILNITPYLAKSFCKVIVGARKVGLPRAACYQFWHRMREVSQYVTRFWWGHDLKDLAEHVYILVDDIDDYI